MCGDQDEDLSGWSGDSRFGSYYKPFLMRFGIDGSFCSGCYNYHSNYYVHWLRKILDGRFLPGVTCVCSTDPFTVRP